MPIVWSLLKQALSLVGSFLKNHVIGRIYFATLLADPLLKQDTVCYRMYFVGIVYCFCAGFWQLKILNIQELDNISYYNYLRNKVCLMLTTPWGVSLLIWQGRLVVEPAWATTTLLFSDLHIRVGRFLNLSLLTVAINQNGIQHSKNSV